MKTKTYRIFGDRGLLAVRPGTSHEDALRQYGEAIKSHGAPLNVEVTGTGEEAVLYIEYSAHTYLYTAEEVS